MRGLDPHTDDTLSLGKSYILFAYGITSWIAGSSPAKTRTTHRIDGVLVRYYVTIKVIGA
ncbi:MAG: hypothetical protein ACREDL_25195 [Bradyrhizobium sp.]